MPSRNLIDTNEPGFDVGQLLTRARSARRAGDLAQAACLIGDVLARFPANPRARKALRSLGPTAVSHLVRRAEHLHDGGNLHLAETNWASAALLKPEHSGIGLSLTQCRIGLGQMQEALDAVEQVLHHHPTDPAALDIKGRILRDLGRGIAAEACHKAALGHGAADAGPLNNLGVLAQAHGDVSAATAHFRQAVELRPGEPDLHNNLAQCLTYDRHEPHLSQMQSLLSESAPGDPALAPLHFAMFKALDDLGDRDAAFAHLVTGNHLRKSRSRFDSHQEARRFTWYKSLFTEPVDQMVSVPLTGPMPIFVVGLPRSGTTLVERILAQAEGTVAGGELSVVSNAVAPVMRQMQSAGRDRLGSSDLQMIRTRLQSDLSLAANGAPVIIDKMPLNFRWAGFICAALPEARIVSLSRRPEALAWSLFRHLFAGAGNPFAYDIADIIVYMLLHRDLMEFWRARFGDRIVSLRYSDLTENTEPTIRNLIAACDLPWSDTCLTPHTARATVLTASASQVRKAIYSGSDENWRKYETHLEPMTRALRASGLI